MERKNWLIFGVSSFMLIVITLSLGLGLGLGIKKEEIIIVLDNEYSKEPDPLYEGNYEDVNWKDPDLSWNDMWLLPLSYAFLDFSNISETEEEIAEVSNFVAVQLSYWVVDDDFGNSLSYEILYNAIWKNTKSDKSVQHISISDVSILHDRDEWIFDDYDEFHLVPGINGARFAETFYLLINDEYICKIFIF